MQAWLRLAEVSSTPFPLACLSRRRLPFFEVLIRKSTGYKYHSGENENRMENAEAESCDDPREQNLDRRVFRGWHVLRFVIIMSKETSCRKMKD
jgi:hypothetical protein